MKTTPIKHSFLLLFVLTGSTLFAQQQANQVCNNLRDSINIYSQNVEVKIDEIITELKSLHGVNDSGEILNKMDTIHVEQILLENGQASLLKQRLLETKLYFDRIVSNCSLSISEIEKPFTLNLSMEENGTSWEEYSFKGMPALGALPILKYYLTKLDETKLKLLSQLDD